MAPCSDLLVIEDDAKIGYPPARKLHLNQAVRGQGLQASQAMATFFDGVARHTKEGYAFQRRAAEVGFRQAVRERDEPFGDQGPSTFKGR